MKYQRNESNDHVLIKMEICVAIGVEESQDDLPQDFSNDVQRALKDLGIGVITSSISPIHRQRFKATAREILAKLSGTNNKQNLT